MGKKVRLFPSGDRSLLQVGVAWHVCRLEEEEGIGWRERYTNGAGSFLLCSVLDSESMRYCIVFPEGRGINGGWGTFSDKLRSLGVGCSQIEKLQFADTLLCRGKGGLREGIYKAILCRSNKSALWKNGRVSLASAGEVQSDSHGGNECLLFGPKV